MSGPIEITENDLFAKIGRLVVENDALRDLLSAATAQPPTEPSPSPEDPGSGT